MGIYNSGRLIKTDQTHGNGKGLYYNVCHVEEGGMRFKRCQDYYWHIKREWDIYVGMYPDAHGHIKERDRDNLERMCFGASYAVRDDTIHVDNWAVNEEDLFHKHPEFGPVPSMDGVSEIEFTVKDGECDLCGTEASGEVLFLHNMYKL